MICIRRHCLNDNGGALFWGVLLPLYQKKKTPRAICIQNVSRHYLLMRHFKLFTGFEWCTKIFTPVIQVSVGRKSIIPAYSKVSLCPQPTIEDSDEELEYADSNSEFLLLIQIHK